MKRRFGGDLDREFCSESRNLHFRFLLELEDFALALAAWPATSLEADHGDARLRTGR